MRAALFYGGPDIRVEEVPRPEPAAGEVLVEVAAAGICGSDLHPYRDPAGWRPRRATPYRAGHELSGVVVETGSGVEHPKVGQRVAVEPLHLLGCGLCRHCRTGRSQLCLGRGDGRFEPRRSAGFAEFDVALAENAMPIPEDLEFESAVLTDLYACALHALHRVPVGATETLAIIGGGPMALTLGQVARSLGARRTILVARRHATLELALQTGAADQVVDGSRSEKLASAVRGVNDGRDPEVVFESVGGTAETLAQAISVVSPGGRIGCLGLFTGDVALPARQAFTKEIELIWSNGYGAWEGRSEFRMALDLLAARRVSAPPLVSHRYPLQQIGAAFAAAADRATSGAFKVVVLPRSVGAPA